MKKMILYPLAILLFCTVNVFSQNKKIEKKIKQIDTYCNETMELWDFPAMAVAIVKDGEIVFEKGYGKRNINEDGAVDENTLFAIASNTKAYTSASLAILVDEGKISWDDKVQHYLPWFELYDTYVSKNMTIRDLLCHRSGLKTFSGDIIWTNSNHSREEVVRRARYLEPTHNFRTNFGYSNIMFIAAGLIVEEVSGVSWDSFVKTHFFEPLGMDRTITSTLDLKNTNNYCAPHIENDAHETVTIPWQNWDNVAPAGAIISSVHDASQWMMLQLNGGIWGEDTLFTPRQSHEMWKLHTPTPVSAYSLKVFPSTTFSGYGLGWSLKNYKGHKLVSHGGGYDGMLSQTMLIPDMELGFIVLTAKDDPVYYAVSQKILDILLGESEKDFDYSAMLLNRKLQTIERENSAEPIAYEGTNCLPIEEYCGTYGGAIYGNCEVTMKEGELYIDLLPTDGYESVLTPMHGNCFSIRLEGFPSLPQGTVNFILDTDNTPRELEVFIPNPDFFFEELEFKRIK